jgi:hypothetical protein
MSELVGKGKTAKFKYMRQYGCSADEYKKAYIHKYREENRERIRRQSHEKYLRTNGQYRTPYVSRDRSDYSGIYGILCTETGQWYVGKSYDVFRRLNEHIKKLMRGEHENYKMQEAFTNYGITGFSLTVLCLCSLDDLHNQEARLIREYDSLENGMNLYLPTPDDL